MFGRGGELRGVQLQHETSPLDVTTFYTLHLLVKKLDFIITEHFIQNALNTIHIVI